jgi:hypothetical protein
MSDRPELTQAPGSRDSELPWRPPTSSPTAPGDPAMQAPDVDQDLPGMSPKLGGAPSTGWSTEDE